MAAVRGGLLAVSPVVVLAGARMSGACWGRYGKPGDGMAFHGDIAGRPTSDRCQAVITDGGQRQVAVATDSIWLRGSRRGTAPRMTSSFLLIQQATRGFAGPGRPAVTSPVWGCLARASATNWLAGCARTS